MRKIARTLAIALIATAGAAGLGSTGADAAPKMQRIIVTQPCELEDGSGQRACYWVGSNDAFGNGVGSSFVALNGGTDKARYVYMNAPRSTVGKRAPLVVQVTGKRANVIHGRTVLVKSAPLVK